ncbi:FAST kinase domain-containing protein 1, mitochondrial [Gadus chalcogrammus]|uniref:FAST kinase domain-containing protein 1, mitochondrial n=1 Tax=Gadus chalcogrammus TaxID=1042646 RepID=UPI0024C4D367|nr:FAST kinase domain-containing protein 1, mitochondrial [Gadus chalcogrammus]XP_056435615.1 FAST kinase domain-containing protein 1, mitochondrial [Gadus chalcogrammus]
MFRLHLASACVRRSVYSGPGNRDLVLDQLKVCFSEDQVFEVVGRNKAKLAVNHVGCAVGMLWQFQKEKPQLLRTVGAVKSHPQFLTLRVLAENKISLMDDCLLVDMLYDVLRLNVEPHDSLVQQLVSEASVRLDSFPLSSLSKFAICLNDQQLQLSPLMGRITDILSRKLSTINDARILTVLMISVSPMVSPRLRDRLLDRADHLLDSMDPVKYNNPRRVVQFLRNIRFGRRPLLEKCNRILLRSVPRMDAENLSIIMGLYQSLQFNNCEFRLAAKQRLTELIDSSTDPAAFTKLFVALCPMASTEIREWLESTALLLADEFNPQQALILAEGLEEIQCRNLNLINKIASIIQKNLRVYKSMEVARITQALFLLHYQNPELFNKLRSILISFLQDSLYPSEVTMLTRVLATLPGPRLEAGVVARLDAVLPQCNLSDLNTLAQAVGKCARNDASYRHSSPSQYVRLLQGLSRCGHERLDTADRLDVLLDELRYASGEWFEETLLEHTMATLQRMTAQVSWSSVPDLAHLLTKTNHLCAPLLDRIATVTLKDIDKIHPSATYATLLPFAVLNYDSPTADELFDVCIEHLKPHIRSFDPHMLVLLAYALVVADCFPEEVFREIFNVDFLAKLDAHLETMPDLLNMRIRLRLMEVNRAVCLECPEYQVPWFHARYCQQLQKKGSFSSSLVQKQIHKILAEVLGGADRARASVLTPYFYTIDFECVLDRYNRPVAYSEPNTLQISDGGKVQWRAEPTETVMNELPPGAQRVAVDFLDSKAFCKNSRHMKGETGMRKRHLEIMGYRVVQIPHYEWNSMELSTQDAWVGYLKKKIFTEVSSS